MATILIVDDDPTIRAVATELLRCTDHAILEAEDGEQAIDLVNRLPIDLIVLDMLMPNKDGLECLMELRAKRSDVPILAISGGGGMDADLLLRTAAAFGADDTMRKPLRLATFAAKVTELLDRRPHPRAAA
jgi:DNA-binding response OmpR family regulator